MPAMTNYLADKVLNETLRNIDYVGPATVYLSLHTADPTRTGSHASECAGTGYARKAITFGAPADNGTAEECASTALVDFGDGNDDWGTLAYWGIEDASAAGNMLYHGHLKDAGGADTTKIIQTGDPVTVAVGAQTVSLL